MSIELCFIQKSKYHLHGEIQPLCHNRISFLSDSRLSLTTQDLVENIMRRMRSQTTDKLIVNLDLTEFQDHLGS